MQTCLYPGTFDPVTLGHVDIVERAARLFDQVVVAVATNPHKNPMFSPPQRLELMREAVHDLPNVRVEIFDTLLVAYARSIGAVALIRGLRAVSDFEYEFQMALMNRRLDPGLETVFLTPREEFSFISSQLVKQVARYGGNVRAFVPAHVEEVIRARVAAERAAAAAGPGAPER